MKFGQKKKKKVSVRASFDEKTVFSTRMVTLSAFVENDGFVCLFVCFAYNEKSTEDHDTLLLHGVERGQKAQPVHLGLPLATRTPSSAPPRGLQPWQGEEPRLPSILVPPPAKAQSSSGAGTEGRGESTPSYPQLLANVPRLCGYQLISIEIGSYIVHLQFRLQ